jgi:proteasome lid subunit RPN8/RPN11
LSPPAEATLSARLLQDILDAARAALPNEGVGLLVGAGYFPETAAPDRYVPLTNAAASPYRYEIDAQEQLRIWLELEAADEVPWAIVHSHVTAPPKPSATDVELAYFPDSLYVISSLAVADQPVIRAWSIRDGRVNEVPLAVSRR